MLLGKSSVFCPAFRKPDEFPITKSKVSFTAGSKRKPRLIRGSFSSEREGKTRLDIGNNAAITTITEESKSSSIKGVGILDYFEGKNIFITGATGLLGKAYKLGLIQRPGRQAWEVLPNICQRKLIPVAGNICEPNLGMDSDSASAISKEVNVIVDSAAITTLNERYDILLDANVKAPQRLMMFAKTCKNLEHFVHISTAYVNGEEEGTIFEKPRTMGKNARKEMSTTSSCLSPQLNIENEINLATKSCTATTDYDIAKDMKRIGMERAKLYGWYNTYHLTKAMAEMTINESRGNIPVLIVRPTMIESCYKEPVPGWIQGNRIFDPFIISYGKGQLLGFLGDPDSIMDVIPLDIVVNATIGAIAKHGKKYSPAVNVYHMASSVVNPLRFSEFFEYLYEYFSSDPLIESQSFTKINYYDNHARIKYFDNFNNLSKYTREEISRRARLGNLAKNEAMQTRELQKQCKARVAYVKQLCKVYEFLGFFKATFHAGNTQKLWSEMSHEEQTHFTIDVPNIDWRKYFQEIHIPGLRKYLLNDKWI